MEHITLSNGETVRVREITREHILSVIYEVTLPSGHKGYGSDLDHAIIDAYQLKSLNDDSCTGTFPENESSSWTTGEMT